MKWFALLLLLPVALIVGALVLNRPPLLDPPGALARLRIYLTTNVAQTRADHPQPELRTPVFPLGMKVMRKAVLAAMDKLGWTQVRAEPDAIRAVVLTPLFGFRDDVTVQLAPTESGGTRLEARSASRVGRGDLAANERHLLDLFSALRAAVPPVAPH